MEFFLIGDLVYWSESVEFSEKVWFFGGIDRNCWK